jgi:hypothetical protein
MTNLSILFDPVLLESLFFAMFLLISAIALLLVHVFAISMNISFSGHQICMLYLREILLALNLN